MSDKDLSAAGGVGQGPLRPTDRHTATIISRSVPCGLPNQPLTDR